MRKGSGTGSKETELDTDGGFERGTQGETEQAGSVFNGVE